VDADCPPSACWFLTVQGTRSYAHRIALLASSDAFRAMFDGGYRVSRPSRASLLLFSEGLPRAQFAVGAAQKTCTVTLLSLCLVGVGPCRKGGQRHPDPEHQPERFRVHDEV